MKQDILVITATLGNRSTLRTTLESVRNVGGERVHHVLVCPESRISSIKEEYGPDIDCLSEPEGRRGIYAALNHGFRTYGHDYTYLTFINDDDHWLPDYRRLIDAVTTDPSLDLAYGRTAYVNHLGAKIGSQTSCGNFKAFAPLLRRNVILLTQQATLMRSDLYFRIGGFDESYKLVADTKFWVMASRLPICYKYINRECAAYMIQSGQLSSDKTTQRREHERMMEEFSEVNDNPWAYARFRMANLGIYLRRFFRQRGYVRNPFTPPLLAKVLIIMLPWSLRRRILNRCFGYRIDPRARIGMSFIYPDRLVMGPGAYIGHLNVAIHLDLIQMGRNTTITAQNWITGFPAHGKGYFEDFPDRKPQLIMKEGSAITKKHLVDCTDLVTVGMFTSVGGYGTQILSHSTDLNKNDQSCHPISIGDNCFVGTRSIILPGAVLPDHCVLGAGAVLNKKYTEMYCLYAGVPARFVKKLTTDMKFLTRRYRPGQKIVD